MVRIRRVSTGFAAFLAVLAAFVLIIGRGHRTLLAQPAPTFAVVADVREPMGGVIKASNGSLYGTSRTGGGSSNCGYVYRLNPQSGGTFGLTILHTFAGAPADGCRPLGELVEGPDGGLYGLTQTGGPHPDAAGFLPGTGTVFRIDSSGAPYSMVHAFAPQNAQNVSPDGLTPLAGLTLGPNGIFYGTTSRGGLNAKGTIFSFATGSGLQVRYNFSGFPQELSPQDALTLIDGNLYGGVVASNASNLAGALFRMTPAGVVTRAFTFPRQACSERGCYPLGANPWASPTAAAGAIYVVGHDFGAAPGGFGTVVRVEAGTGTLVYGFSGGVHPITGVVDGGNPHRALTLGADGYLYGLTGGANQVGPTIFRLATDGSSFETLHQFVLSGAGPQGRLLEIAPGEFIGTSASGGAGGLGFVYRLSIPQPNHAPIASDSSATTAEDTTLSGQLSATDTDNDPLTFSLASNGTRGHVSITDAATGAVTYVPSANASGTDTFAFNVSDGTTTSNTATVTVTIAPVNDAPVASDSAISTPEDTPMTSTLVATDIDSPSLTYAVVTNGTRGTAQILDAATGLFRYTPNPGAVGADTFTFRATDGNLASNLATVSVTIVPLNDPPDARTGVITTTEATPVNGALSATDPGGNGLVFSVSSSPAQGVVTITNASAGAFTYTPNAGAIGYDTFAYQVSNGGATSTATEMVFIVASSPRWPGNTRRVSVATDGTQGDEHSFAPRMSADGRFVAFTSRASTLVTNDTNGSDVFLYDRQAQQTTRISVASNGEQGNSESDDVSAVSADGRFIAFSSQASNLVPGDSNGIYDVFVHDRLTAQTTRVSVASDGTEANSASRAPAISADGRFVAFHSFASNLVAGDTNGQLDVYVHDRQTAQTTRVSVASDGTQSNDQSLTPALSADGRFVVFSSAASTLVAGDTAGIADVFVHDRQLAQTTRVSVASNGTPGNSHSESPQISPDGRLIVFHSQASNLVPGDTNGFRDVFVHDRESGQTSRVSVASDGTQGDFESAGAAMSADGRFVVFSSRASTLVAGDTNEAYDVFVRDRQTAQTTRVTVASDGYFYTTTPSLSADGQFVAFDSFAETLVPGDTNHAFDAFVLGGFVADRHPTAHNGSLMTLEDSPALGTLSASDPNGDPLTFSIVANGSLGVAAVTNSATGTFTYTPNSDMFGTDTFTFRVSDGTAYSDVATMTVAIAPANDAPVAFDGAVTTDEDVVISESLNAIDVDGPALTFAIVTNGTRGTATITDAATGAFTYTPNPNANGVDTFTFRATDGTLDSNVATVTVTINPVADPQVALSTSTLNFGGQRVGTSSTAQRYTVGARPAFVAAADLNGDGRPDLVAANQLGHNISVLVNNGNGIFASAVSYATGGTNPTALVLRDFNGDGRTDVIVTNQGSRDISVLLGNGNGTLQNAVRYPAGQGSTAGAFGIAAGDFNGDGRLDVAVANSSNAVNILAGNGDGTFLPGGTVGLANAIDVAAGDFNNDGVLDLATARQVALGNGNGTFVAPVNLGVNGEFVAVADFNGDGALDVASALRTTPGALAIRLGNGNGTFSNGGSFPVGRNPFFITAGDVSGDGRADVVLASEFDSSVGILLNNGDGTFQPYVNYGYHAFAESVAIADFDGDGVADVAVASFTGNNVGVLIGKGNGTFQSSLTVTVLNTGDAPLHISQRVITGPDAANFFIEAAPCLAATDPGGGCPIIVGFAPTSTGAKSATLRITSDASGSPHEIALSGFGLVAPVALNGSFSTANNTPVSGQLAATDDDPLTFAIVSNGTLGTAVVTNASTGAFTYTPNPGASGADSFTFRAYDGTLTSNVATVSVSIATAPLTVTVVAPNGGERVFANVPTTIRWTVTGATRVDVELSRNGGTTYTAIAGCAALGGSATSCVWTPAGPATTTARVRVTARGAGTTTVSDTSNANFSIVTAAPSITVTAPNSAVVWSAGSTRTITWNHNLGLGSFVAIDLSRNGGGAWESIAPSVPNAATSGTFNWVVSGPETASALVRIRWVDGNVSDVSNVAFAIVAPTIEVTTPNTAATWRAGNTNTIRVTHNLGLGQVIAFDVSRDGGTTWSAIGTTTTTSNTAATLAWAVTGPSTTQARIRARWVSTPGVFDVSDVNFRINPRVIVTAPNTAVTWTAGTTRTVTWTHNLDTGATVDIDVSVDNGATWLPLATGVANATATNGSRAVRMPSTATAQALIRVSPSGALIDGDVSDVPFTLAAPTIVVNAPNTNVNWTVGSARSINWTHNLGTSESVSIEVSRDGGNTWGPVTASVQNSANASGTFSWTVTGPATTTARVRVRWTFDGTVQDLSNVNFRIQ